GLLGSSGMSASPSLVSLEKTTGAASRVIAWSIAAWLVSLSCLPKFAGLIVNMPRPVMAAALFFNGSLMFVAGIQVALSRPVTLRASVIIGFSILAALTAPLYSDFYQTLPDWTRQITGSIISMAVVASVSLNALFLLGSWRYGQVRLGADSTPVTSASFDAFFEKQVKNWKIGADDARHARSVVDAAIDDVSHSALGPIDVEVASDTFDLTVTLRYLGNLPPMPDARPKREMLEEQSFVNGLTGYLAGLHADRVDRSAKGDACEIALLFRI
ncbi:MAG TPA: solute carrier family 23 protein, partial [Roseiarcus sp.]